MFIEKPKVCILTQEREDECCKNLASSLMRLNCTPEILEYTNEKVTLQESSQNSAEKIFVNGKELNLKQYKAVILRSWGTAELGRRFYRAFDFEGVTTCDPINGIVKANSKIETYLRLKKNQAPTPRSFIFRPNSFERFHIDNAVNSLSHSKFYVIKPDYGTGGKNISFFRFSEDVHQTARNLEQKESGFLIQEYIDQPQIGDKNVWHTRVLVIDGQVVGALRIFAQGNMLVSNTSSGGKATLVEIEESEKNIAIHAASLFKLNVAGVDLIQDGNYQSYILEVNDSPKLSTFDSLGIKASFSVAKFISQRILMSQIRSA